MNWLSFLVVALSALHLGFPAVAFSESDNLVVIESISHVKGSDAHETITFKLAAQVVPKVFQIEGEKPRLVVDFPQSIYLGKNVISLSDSMLASTIRIGLHKTPVERTRVVVDLSKQLQVQYTSEYLEQDNSFIIKLKTDSLNLQTAGSSELPPENQSMLPVQDKTSVAEEQNPVDTTIPVEEKIEKIEKEMVAQPVVKNIDAPVVPTILEISFDDSSSRGEMVLFRLNDFYPPTVSAIEKGNPRVLCDFMSMNVSPSVQHTILAQGKYIERIRTARHKDPDKVRVVLDLAPDRDYDLQQVYFRNDNLFVLIVNELVPKQDKAQ